MADTERATPAIIVDDLYVTYRVWGAKKPGSGPKAIAKRMLGRDSRAELREVPALKGISLTAHHGEAIGVIGRNGSGKSTLLRTMAGLHPATKGTIYTDAKPSLLGVNAALMNSLTGERNIVLGCLAMGLTPDEVEAKKESIIEFSGIGDFVNLPMSTYSSGMGARLRFAIASSVTHEILLIDEALSTGDREFRQRSEERIRELRDEAGVVFLVSHSLETVRDSCNRAIWIDKGVMVMDGAVDEVVDAYEKGPAKTPAGS